MSYTSTNRGIGYEFVRQLVENKDNIVIAACRTPSNASKLNALKSSAQSQLHVLQLDISDEQVSMLKLCTHTSGGSDSHDHIGHSKHR
jgi:NAD(P)-dependent dehydrogenase (short-subunit alcohol dehydrogenase family)